MAPFQRIAVAIDGSETAGHAVGVAIDLAKHYKASLLVVAVVPPPAVYVAPNSPILPAAIPDSAQPRLQQLVEAAVASARASGVASATGICGEGIVVDEILAKVEADASDLLVVGSRGLSTAQRILLGSVSSALVNRAGCPVLVVRPPKPRPASRPAN
jgi:nucleotide-binding universal stress UspA family protein